MIFPLQKAVLPTLLLCAASLTSAGQSASTLTPADLVDVALQRGAPVAGNAAAFASSSWLAALPSISLSYLGSDESDGTDETEFSINLPLKSSRGREFDREIAKLSVEAEASGAMRRRLYFSGLVREALWSLQLAITREDFSSRKIDLLRKLEARHEHLLSARAASEYSLLAIRQDRLRAQIEHQEFRQEASRWQDRYRQLTGLGGLPPVLDEPAPPTAFNVGTHPEMRLLELDWLRRKQLLSASGQKSEPWNLAIKAKQLDNPQFDENQYGLSLEVPMSFLDMDSEANRGEGQEAARQYWQAHDELSLGLDSAWQHLLSEQSYLRQRQSLLDEAVITSANLLEQLGQLSDSSEMDQEIWLRRTIQGVDILADEAINKLLIGQNRSMLRQSAGIPL